VADIKVIQTALLLALSVVVVWRDRELFLTPPEPPHLTWHVKWRRLAEGPAVCTVGGAVFGGW
jgi:hypothetical protein